MKATYINHHFTGIRQAIFEFTFVFRIQGGAESNVKDWRGGGGGYCSIPDRGIGLRSGAIRILSEFENRLSQSIFLTKSEKVKRSIF